MRSCKKNANYVLTVKGNQKYLHRQLTNLFRYTRAKYPELISSYTSIEKQHGRFEERTIAALATHGTKLLFLGVMQVAELTRTRETIKLGRKSSEQIFLITDIDYDKIDAKEFLHLKRSYWGIENALH